MKWQNIVLLIVVILFIVLHFVSLDRQTFIGDEASPMLLIDRMWDGVTVHDPRFLAYPFLFYMDPLRSIFSGTLLHLVGPNMIILRLPSILFSFLTFGLLILIFTKEKIPLWLRNLSLLSYTLSPLVINDRSGGGDAQMRFLFLLTGYLLWQTFRHPAIEMLRLSLITWSFSMLTMLNTVVLFPAVVFTFWKNRKSIDRKTILLLIGISLFFAGYFGAWLLLPYLAYTSGFQDHYINRGLFYYFSRVDEGVAQNPLLSIVALSNYTSWFFAGWLIMTSIIALTSKHFWTLQLISLPAWIFVMLLNRSSFHIIMYVAFFFFQAVLVTDYLVKKYPRIKIIVVIFLLTMTITNATNLFTTYFQSFQKPPKQLLKQITTCLDTAVIRMYTQHKQVPPQPSCESTSAQ